MQEFCLFFNHGAVYSVPDLLAADVSLLSQRRKRICPGDGRACSEGFKLGMKWEGDNTRPTRDELRGRMMGLGVRQGALLKCIYTSARNMGNKQEELKPIVRQENCDSIATMETWWNWNCLLPQLECCNGWLQALQKGQARSFFFLLS